MKPKLHEIWGLVLVRGLLEGALAVIYFKPAFQSAGALAAFVSTVILGGGLLELVMAYRLRGHTFRSILIFTGLSSVLLGGFILMRLYLNLPVTLALLVVLTGLWVALRGFAALWLGLSIVEGTFDRAVPVTAGLLGLVVGGAGLWLEVELSLFVALISIYGLGSLLVHLLVALRMRAEHRRHVHEGQVLQAE